MGSTISFSWEIRPCSQSHCDFN